MYACSMKGFFIVSKGTTYLFLLSFPLHCFNDAEEEMCSLYKWEMLCACEILNANIEL